MQKHREEIIRLVKQVTVIIIVSNHSNNPVSKELILSKIHQIYGELFKQIQGTYKKKKHTDSAAT